MATEQIEEVLTGDPKPKPGLAEEHRAKLDSIVQQMVKNKESDSTIQMVVNDFKQKYSGATTPQEAKPEPQQPAFKPMTDWLSTGQPQGYQPLAPENAVNEHNTKTTQSSERIKAHLNDIDNSVKNLLYEHKKDLLGRVTSQKLAVNPSESGPINYQAQQLAQKDKQDVYVSPVEIESFKSEIPNNPVLLRRGLAQKAKDLSKTNPTEANSLKADIYRLDRQNNPEKESKIASNIEKLNKGEYDYDIVNGQLVKPEGFLGSLATGYKEKVQAFDDYGVYKSGDEKAMIDLINKRLKHDPDQAVPVAEEGWLAHPLAEMARMTGGQPLKPLIGGAAAGIAAGPEAGVAAASAITAPEMYKLTFGATLPQNYAAIKKQHPDWSDSQVLQEAVNFTHNQANIDALSGAAMGVLGAKVGLQPTGLNRGLLQKSLGSALKQVGEEATKKTLEGLGVGAVGATGQLVKNLMAQQAGLPVDESEGLKEQLIGGLGMTIGMTMVAKFPEVLKPKTYNQILQSFKGVPKQVVEGELNNLQQSGQITQEQSNNAQVAIKEHTDIDNSIKSNVPESDRLKVQDKIKKRNELEASLETTDKAYHPDIKEQIKGLNEEIVNLSNGKERGELQQLIDKEHKSGNLQGFVTETLRNASENDLKKYFKEISEQAHDENSEAVTIATFGENIVNKAKELYPKEVTPESKISIIQPGEIKHPEIITNNDNIFVGDVLDKEVSYKGQKGELYQDGQTIVFKVKGLNREYEIGNINEIKNHPIGVYGIEHESSVVNIDNEGNIVVRGNAYKNNYSDPLMSINRDKDGNVVSVNLETKDGQKRTFRGNIAEDIAYNISLKEINKNNETRAVFEDFINSDESTKKQIEDAGLSEAAKEGADESTSKVQRIKIEPETITIKPKDAISIEKPDALDVRQQAGDGETMGAGNIQPEIPAGQERQPTQEAGAVTGQEGVGDPGMIGITHAQMDAVARELGIETYEKDSPESLRLWDEQARERFTKDPDALNKLIAKLRNGEGVDKVETRMMIMHLADLKAKYDLNPTTERLNEIKRTRDLYNISGREKAREFVARKGSMPTEETLSDYHLTDVDFNKGAPLTEEQVAQSTKEYNEIKKVKDEYNQRIAQLEAENIKLKAEKKLQEEVKGAKKDTKKDYVEERKGILKDIGDKWKKASKESLGASVLPFAKEFAAIAPDVMRLVKNVASEGIEKLPDIIKAVHNQIKELIPQITEKDIHNIIAGEYSRKKPTRSKLSERLYDIKKEAQLINQLDQLLNGEMPKSEKKIRQRNQKIEALRQQIKEVKDDMGLNERTEAQKLKTLKGKYEGLIKDLEDKIVKGDYGPDEKTEPIKLDNETQALRDEYLKLKDDRALRLLKQQYADRSFGEKAVGVISKSLKTGRTLKSSFDVSYPLRQTIVGLSRQLFSIPFTKKEGKWVFDKFKNQRQLGDQMRKMYQAFGSETMYRRIMDEIYNSGDRYKVAEESGLSLADITSPLDKAKEEMHYASYAEDIPLAKHGVKASHRAATVIANKMKWDIFNEFADIFKEQGKTFENSPDDYKQAAIYANKLVGRGFLGQKLEMAAPVIAHVVYSLRLYASRLQLLTQLLNPNFYRKVPQEVRVAYLKDMAKFVAFGGTIMGLSAAAGLKVGMNPYNSDFGTIEVGDSKYDIWGGFKQYAVLFSRLLGGKENAKEDLRPLFSDKEFQWGEKTYGDVILRFLRTKASPELGTLIDVSTGKSFDNKKVTAGDAALDYITPLIWKDIYGVYNDKGTVAAMLTFLLAAHGVGVQTYDKDKGGSTGGAGATGEIGSRTKPTRVTRTNPHNKN